MATCNDLDATKAFDKTVCKALDIDPKAKQPTFLTDPRVLYQSRRWKTRNAWPANIPD